MTQQIGGSDQVTFAHQLGGDAMAEGMWSDEHTFRWRDTRCGGNFGDNPIDGGASEPALLADQQWAAAGSSALAGHPLIQVLLKRVPTRLGNGSRRHFWPLPTI